MAKVKIKVNKAKSAKNLENSQKKTASAKVSEASRGTEERRDTRVEQASERGKKKTVQLKTKHVAILGTVVLLGVLVYFGWNQIVVATVNGKPITRLELIKTLEQVAGRQVLEQLIIDTATAQELKKRNLTVSDEDVQKEIETIEASIQSQGLTLEQALAMQGMSRKDLENSISMQLGRRKLVEGDVSVTDDEVIQFAVQNYGVAEEELDPTILESLKGQLTDQKLQELVSEWEQGVLASNGVKNFRYKSPEDEANSNSQNQPGNQVPTNPDPTSAPEESGNEGDGGAETGN